MPSVSPTLIPIKIVCSTTRTHVYTRTAISSAFFHFFLLFSFFSAFLRCWLLRSYLKFLDTNKSIFENTKKYFLRYLVIFLFLYHLQLIMRFLLRRLTSHKTVRSKYFDSMKTSFLSIHFIRDSIRCYVSVIACFFSSAGKYIVPVAETFLFFNL
jgi:hypothetical protein